MKKFCLLCCLLTFLAVSIHAQSLRTLKNKFENAIIDEVVDDIFNDSEQNKETKSTTSETSSDRPAQKSGGTGLDSSLDDVPGALAQASNEFSAKEYRSARSSLHKAMRTLEINIGNQLLASLPENLKGLDFKPDADEVGSSNTGWAGLAIHREYQKNDKWTGLTIYNSSWAGIATTAINTGMYAEYSDEEENQKSITIKGYDAVITFSDSEGYALNVSVAQQTFVIFEGVNIDSESEMISIGESLDYTQIKKTLGDQ